MIGLSRPHELAFDDARCRKSGDSWKPLLWVKLNFFSAQKYKKKIHVYKIIKKL